MVSDDRSEHPAGGAGPPPKVIAAAVEERPAAAPRPRPVRRRFGSLVVLSAVLLLSLAANAWLLVAQSGTGQSVFRAAAGELGEAESHLMQASADLASGSSGAAAALAEVEYAQGLVRGVEYPLARSGVFPSDLKIRLGNDQTALSVLAADGRATNAATAEVGRDLRGLIAWAHGVNWNTVTPGELERALSRIAS